MPIPQTPAQQAVTDRHNELVKERYRSPNITDWLMTVGNVEEGYLEIPSNETLSGHAEILEFDVEDYDFDE